MSKLAVRTIRPHDTTDGMKHPGDVYDRTQADADKLSSAGIVEIASAPAKRVAKRK
ncbi:hypothetical protein ACUXST_000139 [Sphingomonas sp. F9_3S_D5_B_2]